ncbi:MAG: M20 family metallopeptidase [Bauldia sp.]|nr:M20 family metallopeptidase [Bauldia sp.]
MTLHRNTPGLDEILSAVDEGTVVGLTRDLVRIDSTNPPGRERAVAELILGRAAEWGIAGELQPIDNDRANAILRLRGSGSGPTLLYCGHLDTVPLGAHPWSVEPFGGERKDDRLYGRGTTDMKGGVASMLVGLAALARSGVELPGDIVFACVAGEEVDCIGSRHFLESGGMAGVDWLVISEPTNLDLVVAHKGALRAEITTQGRAAHGAMPALGVNAILHMTKVIERLGSFALPPRPHPLLSASTLSVNMISGGFRTNVVPDICRIAVDIRTLPGHEHPEVIALVQQELDRLGTEIADFSGSVRIIDEAAPVATPMAHPLVRTALATATRAYGTAPAIRGVDYFSDASILQPPTGVPTLLVGPGDETLAHQVNESVAVEALVKASRLFATLPMALFGVADPAMLPE